MPNAMFHSTAGAATLGLKKLRSPCINSKIKILQSSQRIEHYILSPIKATFISQVNQPWRLVQIAREARCLIQCISQIRIGVGHHHSHLRCGLCLDYSLDFNLNRDILPHHPRCPRERLHHSSLLMPIATTVIQTLIQSQSPALST